MVDWKKLRAMFSAARPAPTLNAASLTARTPEQQHNLEVAWWLWRHHFLEAQRLRLLHQRTASAASRLSGGAAAVVVERSPKRVVPVAPPEDEVTSAAQPAVSAPPVASADSTGAGVPATQADEAATASTIPATPAVPAAVTVVPPVPGASQPAPVASPSPAVSVAAAQVLAAAFEAGQEEPPERTPIAGTDREAAESGPARTIPLVSPPAPTEPPSRWPAGPGQLAPRVLEQTIAQLLDDADVRQRGVTKNKLKSAGAGGDAEALLAWLDAAEVLAPTAEQGVPRWRTPRPLTLTEPETIRERLAATPLPDAERVALVRAAFGAVVPIAGLGGGPVV
jgi:hypothetical protein